MSYWMFRPLSGFSQSLEWSTEIIRSKASEQRIALRAFPRVQYNFKHKLDRKSFQIAKSILMTDVYCKVPDWALRYTATIGNGTNKVVTIGSHVFAVNDEVVLWLSDLVFQVSNVVAITSTSITIDSVDTSGTFLLMKMIDSNISGGIQASAGGDTWSDVSLTAESRLPINYGVYTASTYRSKPVYPFQAVVEDSLSEKISWVTETIDNDLGIFDVLKTRNKVDSIVSIRTLLTDTSTLDVLKWFQTMLGKQQEFYASSGFADFSLVQAATSGATTIRVYGRHQYLDVDDIQIKFIDGSTVNLDISSLTQGPLTNGEYTTDIAFTSAIGQAINPTQAIKISKLYLLRQNIDRIELVHGVHDSNLVGVTVPCMAMI